MNDNVCKICGHQNRVIDTFTAREMMFGYRDEFKYFKCDKCSCIQISEFPNSMDKYYPNGYYSLGIYDGKRFKGSGGTFYRLRNKASFFRDNIFYKILHSVSPIEKYEVFQNLGITLKSRVLDVGCGNGDFFIYPFKEMGFENVFGCDPFINSEIFYDNGLKIFKSDVFGISDKWDVIIYNHSFEHLPNPLENIQKIKKLLSPNGICIIRMPVVPCYAWEKYGINWFQLDAPRHFFLHSPESLQLLCDREELEIKRITYDSTHYQFTASENYEKNIPLVHQRKAKGLKEKIKRIKLNYLAKRLNRERRGDQAGYIIQHIESQH